MVEATGGEKLRATPQPHPLRMREELKGRGGRGGGTGGHVLHHHHDITEPRRRKRRKLNRHPLGLQLGESTGPEGLLYVYIIVI